MGSGLSPLNHPHRLTDRLIAINMKITIEEDLISFEVEFNNNYQLVDIRIHVFVASTNFQAITNIPQYYYAETPS